MMSVSALLFSGFLLVCPSLQNNTWGFHLIWLPHGSPSGRRSVPWMLLVGPNNLFFGIFCVYFVYISLL